jgi:hypothetical protein
VGDRMLAKADLARLPYRAAIFETLRMQCCTAPWWGA